MNDICFDLNFAIFFEGCCLGSITPSNILFFVLKVLSIYEISKNIIYKYRVFSCMSACLSEKYKKREKELLNNPHYALNVTQHMAYQHGYRLLTWYWSENLRRAENQLMLILHILSGNILWRKHLLSDLILPLSLEIRRFSQGIFGSGS